MESIIQKRKECYLCGCQRNLQLHHTWHGSNRKLADKDGLTVWLCLPCHQRLHDKGDHDRYLMEVGEKAYLSHYNKTIGDFINRYGKNVI